jgi:Skp family chaperone for outer membrane proteins
MMNRPARFQSMRLMLCLALAVFGFVAPAHAMNDWYKMGYSDGYLRQERLCQQQMQQRVQAQFAQVHDENQRLRNELIRLRAEMEKQHANQARGGAQTKAQQTAQSQFFEYPAVRDDGRPRRAATVMDDDNNDGG